MLEWSGFEFGIWIFDSDLDVMPKFVGARL
jgi:hypothetical protein